MEYCRDSSEKYELEALDSVERRAWRLISDNKLESKPYSLAHRRKVVCISVFYRILR